VVLGHTRVTPQRTLSKAKTERSSHQIPWRASHGRCRLEAHACAGRSPPPKAAAGCALLSIARSTNGLRLAVDTVRPAGDPRHP
jgi:hypothetical protein